MALRRQRSNGRPGANRAPSLTHAATNHVKWREKHKHFDCPSEQLCSPMAQLVHIIVAPIMGPSDFWWASIIFTIGVV